MVSSADHALFMAASDPKLFLLPGMGADARLVESQRAIAGVEVVVPRWLEPFPYESLASYAQRQAATLDTSHPFYLGGISFGGMVAYEAAHHCAPNLRGVVLISSARSNRGLPWPTRTAGRWLAPLVPLFALRAGKSLMPLVRKRFGLVTPEQAVIFSAMLHDTPPDFLKWSLRAILGWPGPSTPPSVPVLHIHGEADRVLPSRRAHADHVVPGAGHVMNMTHAGQLNQVVGDWILKRERMARAAELRWCPATCAED